ncbi:MAG: histone deacetylase family protein [Pseudomonadota bacterium]
MITIYSEDHRKRDALTELYGGQLIPPFEKPSRMDFILERIHSQGLGDVFAPRDFGLDSFLEIHNREYVTFLQEAWGEWAAAGMKGEAIASSWPARGMRPICPTEIDGKLGYYSLAAETSITEGTFAAARASANVALEGAARLMQEKALFSLCRPPGHHAASDLYGGYCFFNNAALASQSLLNQGAERIAILDVDFHHGNGTQDIFYDRSDVLFISIHGQPQDAFPYFLGYADERGTGEGEGYNLNLPLAPATPFEPWRAALNVAMERISKFSADALVISLGTDTFERDPISFFKLTSDDFFTYGGDLASLRLPTLFVMEGGYAVEEIGVNAVNVLQGFEDAQD